MRLSFIAITFVLSLNGCSANKVIYIERPDDTNLEFWITQRVSIKDLEDKGCTYLPGWMGAEEYLDSRYKADTSGDMAKAPEIHVTYLITGYPDTLDDRAITHIEITDPTITVYGLTLNSTESEIREKMNGVADSFSNMTENDENYLAFNVKNCSFSFMPEKIVISVPVTNKKGVQY